MVEFYQITKAIKSIWIPTLVITGAILNLLTIMVFCRRKMRRYCVSLSMICLAISDTSVLTIPVLFTWIDEVFFNNYFLNNTIWCNLHGYADLISCANSSWIIILISTERWFAVCRPWEKQKKFTNKRVASILIMLFLFSTLFFSYFPLSLRRLKLTAASNENKTDLYECKIYLERTYTLFGIVSVLAVYVLPFFILAFLNLMIIVKLRLRPFSLKSVNFKNQLPKTTSNEINAMSSMLNENSLNQQSIESNGSMPFNTQVLQFNYSKNDRNLSITLVTVAFTFMILTFPFQAYWFYENIYRTFSSTNSTLNSALNETNSTSVYSVDKYLKETTFLIKNMNYLINFFLYSALSKLFRQEFLALISDDKFFLLKCLCPSKEDVQAEQKQNSSFAELSFSMEAFKNLKSGNLKSNRKLFQIKIEPSNFLEYFRNKSLGKMKIEKKRESSVEESEKICKQIEEENLNTSRRKKLVKQFSIKSNSSSDKHYKTSSTQTIRTTIKQYKSKSSNECEHAAISYVISKSVKNTPICVLEKPSKKSCSEI